MLWRRVARDLVVLAAVLEGWLFANPWQVGRGGVVATAFCVVASILLGLAWGYAAHEWGHLAGALLSRSRVHLQASASSLKLFEFRSSENTRQQFLFMAWGGLVVLWAQAAAFAFFLPRGTLGGVVAAGYAIVGALFTTAIEGPIVWRVSRGAAPPGESGSKASPSASISICCR